MTMESNRRRLSRLEQRRAARAPAATYDAAVALAIAGKATPHDFDLIRPVEHDFIVGHIVRLGCEYAIAHAVGYRPIGWGPKRWAGEIISVSEETEATAQARRYLALYARADPADARGEPNLIPWWVQANLLVPIITDEEPALRAQVVQEAPHVEWWPTRYNSHSEDHRGSGSVPTNYDDWCPSSPYDVVTNDGMDGFVEAPDDADDGLPGSAG